jgi:Outer membrane protein beta-barrel domain
MRPHISAGVLAVVLASTLVLVPIEPALSQARISVSGGVAAPFGELSDVVDIGYNIAAGLNFGGTRLPFNARLEGGLNGFNLKDVNESLRILNGTANAIMNLGQQSGSPYLIGGLGIYNSEFAGGDSENAFGVNLGGGLRFPLGRFNTFFEARYHAVFGDQEEAKNLQFIPITFGVVF